MTPTFQPARTYGNPVTDALDALPWPALFVGTVAFTYAAWGSKTRVLTLQKTTTAEKVVTVGAVLWSGYVYNRFRKEKRRT